MEPLLRRTWAEIDLDALEHNFRTLQDRVGADTGVVGVVKADAYGHGALQTARTLENLGAAYLAVSSLDEGRELRHNGIAMPILILGHTPEEYVPQLLEYNMTQAITCEAKAVAYNEAAAACGGVLRCHIKVDTGMSRLGFLCAGRHFDEGVAGAARACRMPHLDVEGIFTHFAVSDEPGQENENFTRQQFDLFCRFVAALEGQGCTFRLRHCANSGAVVHYPETKLDMVRPGILLYGCGEGAEALGLRPVMSLKTTVSTIKVFDPDCTISYGRLYRTEQPTRTGVLPIGYADGFFRCLSNRCSVMTEDGPARVLGRICMDMCMIDLTDKPHVQVGSEVEIFGQRSRVDDLAALAGTIPYELTCAVSKRVPRVYVRDGKIVGTELRLYLE